MEQLEKEARATPFAPGPWNKPFFTSKKIDAFIHGRKMGPSDYKCSHVEHQMKILAIVEGREAEIFNDRTVKYPHRPALEGYTGRMSSILTSCYFNLYDTLINDKKILYDYEYTLKFIYNILFHIKLNKDKTKFIMPTVEFRALKNILHRVKSTYPRAPIFQEEWWKRYIEILEEKIALAKTKEWFSNPKQSNEQKWGNMLGYLKEAERAYIFYGGFDEGIWEYYPCYVSANKNEGFSNYKEYFTVVRNMFLSPDAVQNEDIQCDPSSCMEAAAPAGGKRRKTKKTKRRRTYKKRPKPT